MEKKVAFKMHTTDKTPAQFLEYIRKYGTKTGRKTWTLKWSDYTVKYGVARVTEVDPGVYNMTAEHEHNTLPKLRIDKGVFRHMVSDDDENEWWVIDSGAPLAVSLFNYYNQMVKANEDECGSQTGT